MHALQVRRREAAPDQRLHQEPRRGGLEPVVLEFAAAEQLEQAVGIVDRLRAAPAVAVVPGADLVAVQARQLGREHRVQVGLRVAADRRVAPVQGEVGKVVQVREQAHLAELAHAGNEGEFHVGVARLDRPVQPAQVVAVGARDLGLVQRVQDRLVVLVHQHDHAPAGPLAQRLDQAAEAHGGADAGRVDAGPPGRVLNLHGRTLLQHIRPLEVAAAEVEAHDRVALRPVPSIMGGQTAKQRLAALKKLLDGIHEQALAEPAGARQKEVLTVVIHKAADVAGLVHVVEPFLPDLAEGLDADGEPEPAHGGILRRPVSARSPRRHADGRLESAWYAFEGPVPGVTSPRR